MDKTNWKFSFSAMSLSNDHLRVTDGTLFDRHKDYGYDFDSHAKFGAPEDTDTKGSGFANGVWNVNYFSIITKLTLSIMNNLRFLYLLSAIVLTYPAYSQTQKRLPNVQEYSLQAPASLKVDGKTTEWNNTFQAFNKATQLFYTISNDQENLYLAVQATDRLIINKITRAGLSLTINSIGKKKDKDGARITFPIQSISVDLSPEESQKTAKFVGGSPAAIFQQDDSLTYVRNRRYIDKLRDVKVTGLKEIPDSILSIYNEEGIKARALFDGTGAYNYELAIPLKYIRKWTGTAGEFLYHIKLNGMPPAQPGPAINGDNGPTVNMPKLSISESNPIFISRFGPTDFWGKYTLVK